MTWNHPPWICLGNGADHLLELIFRGFLDPQDKVVYPSPTYSLYGILAQLEAAQSVVLDYLPNHELPIEDILNSQGKLTLIAAPASPTGQAISIAALVTLAESHQGVLVIDEAYCDFAEENALSLISHHANIILVRTLSKGYSLAGVRLGYAIAHPDLIAVINKVKDSYSVDAIALQLGIAAIQDQAYKNEKSLK
ncbi:MAG: histidinol-phosphate aminotransferase family protein [Acaryochloridaceae cyanobacterium RL_2_7]|nr:histidinol-phosphate aminotransferase family protein [Acaryochloridaceae cyanobacterium RL_2_7]